MVIIFCNTCYADIARVIAPVNSIQRDGLSVKALPPASRKRGSNSTPLKRGLFFTAFYAVGASEIMLIFLFRTQLRAKVQQSFGLCKQKVESQGISRRSAIRWNNSWQENGLVTKVKYGLYQKVG